MASFKIHEDFGNGSQHVLKKIKCVEIPQNNIENIVPKIVLPEKKPQILKSTENFEAQAQIKRQKLNTNKRNGCDVTLDVDETENQDPNITLDLGSTTRIDDLISDVEIQCNTTTECFDISLEHNYEYRKDIIKYLQAKEASVPLAKSNYILKQTDLSWNTRTVLIDWLASVSDEYGFTNETFHLAVTYIDGILSQVCVQRNKLQLIGASAMFVASKIEEIYPIDAKEWSYLTGDAFSKRQVLKMEQLIIKLLRYRMQPPTINTFIEHFGVEHSIDSKTLNLAKYLSELVLLEGDQYLNHLPSKLAAASIALARYLLLERKPWTKKLKETSGYTLKQLSPVVQRQHTTFKNSPHKEHQAIQTKYKRPKYNKVALITPRALDMEDLEDEE